VKSSTAVASRKRLPADLPHRSLADRVQVVLTGPALLRPAFWVLRRWAPVLRLGGNVVVSRHDDVVEVLRRDEDFTIAEVNGDRMVRWSGAFILGMDRGGGYEREVEVLRRAVRHDDLATVRRLVAGAASELVEAARPQGQIDVVGGFGRMVAARIVETYFGVPGPDRASTMRWMRALFDVVFLDEGPRARRAAELTIGEQGPYMRDLITTRREAIGAGRPVPDDVLSRLVALSETEQWLDDDAVRRNMNGLIVGALDTTSKAVAHVVDELLRRPAVLADTRRAALAGDIDLVRRYAWELLRFRPHGPILKRHCRAATTVGAAGRRIPAGSAVLVSTLSAMFDPAAFPEAGHVRSDRPPERYLHFGGGLHTCFGQHINAVTVPELVAALVRLPGLRRSSGAAGRLVYDGPFPDRLLVRFDAEVGR
jgi:cytochrome P450